MPRMRDINSNTVHYAATAVSYVDSANLALRPLCNPKLSVNLAQCDRAWGYGDSNENWVRLSSSWHAVTCDYCWEENNKVAGPPKVKKA